MATRPGSSRATPTPRKSSPPSGRARRTSTKTETRDEHYDLVSVLYHALQGADTISQYLQDATDAQDEEIVAYLEDAQTEYVRLATRAKQLLATRLEDIGGDEEGESEEEDEDDDEGEDDED
jgi:hypothetical protein